ncbi:DUF6093 family protein [Microbispora sp. CA-102843]|uniref:DUF6093 family protein n=1 Tax=Microbispora sp. CA-102843 TaxID=3239952 RepID=UPI003D8DCE3F
MSVEDVLAGGRRAAAQLLLDACLIERKAGPPTFDPATGEYVQQWETVYAGPCRLKRSAGGDDTQLGDSQSVTLHQYPVRLPWDAVPEVRREDRLTLTASDDAWAVGRPMEVVDVGYSGTSTGRHLMVEDKS